MTIAIGLWASHVQCQRVAVADSLAARRSLSRNDEPAFCMGITHRVHRVPSRSPLCYLSAFFPLCSLYLSSHSLFPSISVSSSVYRVVKNTVRKTQAGGRSALRSALTREYYFVADALKNFISWQSLILCGFQFWLSIWPQAINRDVFAKFNKISNVIFW